LRIEAYFQRVRNLLDERLLLSSSSVTYDKRSTYEGFIRGELRFVDGSCLHIREFVDVESATDRLMYVYQYVNAAGTLVFRYDNTGHHRSLLTFPHHKHEGSEANLVASSGPDLAAVLDEVEGIVNQPTQL
jgi:hypothetical protein